MNPVNGIYGKDHFINEGSKPIESPPLLPELIQFILTGANYEDKHLTGGINKAWNTAYVDINKTKEFRLLKSFVNFSVKHLEDAKYAGPIKELKNAIEGTRILNSCNLLEVKASSYELKEKIINILKQVNESDLNLLHEHFNKEMQPISIANFPHLVEEYKSLDLIKTNFTEFKTKNHLNENFSKNDALKDSIIKLLHKNAFEKAFEVASSSHLTDYFFENLLLHLSKTNQIDTAFIHINTLLESNLETNSMGKVYNSLTNLVNSYLLSKIPKNLEFPTESIALKYKTFVTLLENLITHLAKHGKSFNKSKNPDDDLEKIGYYLGKYILPQLPLPTCYDLMQKLQVKKLTDEAVEMALILNNSGDEKYENLALAFLKEIGRPITSFDDLEMDDYNDLEIDDYNDLEMNDEDHQR